MKEENRFTTEQEELLRDLLLGERDPEDPAVQEAFDAEPALRVEWEQHLATSVGLKGLGELERSVLDGAHCDVPEGWEEEARRTLREQMEPEPRAFRPRLLLVVTAAAALIIALVSVFRAVRVTPVGGDAGDPSGNGSTYLGNPELAPVQLEPIGTLDAQDELVFRWEFAPADSWQGFCRVVAYDDYGDELVRGSPVLEPEEANTWQWIPTPKQSETLRAAGEVRWQVTSSDSMGERSSSPFASFSSP